MTSISINPNIKIIEVIEVKIQSKILEYTVRYFMIVSVRQIQISLLLMHVMGVNLIQAPCYP